MTRSLRYALLFCLLLTSCLPTGTATPPMTLMPSETPGQNGQPVRTATPAKLPSDSPTWTPTSIPLSTAGGSAANSTWIRANGSDDWIQAGSLVAAKDGL